MKHLRVATCQFSVEADIQHNLRYALKQINEAADRDAQVVHFSECALSGYAGVDISSIEDLDWEELVDATRQIQELANPATRSAAQSRYRYCNSGLPAL